MRTHRCVVIVRPSDLFRIKNALAEKATANLFGGKSLPVVRCVFFCFFEIDVFIAHNTMLIALFLIIVDVRQRQPSCAMMHAQQRTRAKRNLAERFPAHENVEFTADLDEHLVK